MFSQLGRREQYFIVAPFTLMANPLAWAVTSFICWGIVALCIYSVLRGIGWAPANAFWAALLTAAFPMNQSRFTLAVLPYSVSAAFFSLALLLSVMSVRRRSLGLRIMAAVLLLVSFTTNSFLTISPLVIAVVFLALRQREPNKNFWQSARGTVAYVELFSLPFIYWVTKSSLQPVYGIYTTYNQFQMGPVAGLLEASRALVWQFAGLRAIFPNADFVMEASYIAVIFTGSMVLFGWLVRINVQTDAKTLWAGCIDAVVLLGFAVLAVFPYAIVGLRPSFVGLWDSRHQTTLALIAGTLVFALVNAILPARFVPAFCALLVCIFMAADVSVSRQLMADVIDSSAIMYAPQVATIPENTLVAVHADDGAYRMMGRTFRFYELSAMLNMHAPAHTIMGMLASEARNPQAGRGTPVGSDVLAAALAAKCARWVSFPEYGFGDIGRPNQFAELWLRSKLQPPTYWEGLATTVALIFKRKADLDKTVARLDVQMQIHPDVRISCAAPAGA